MLDLNTPDLTASHMLGQADGQITLEALKASPDSLKLVNRSGEISYVSDRVVQDLALADTDSVVGRAMWDFWPEHGGDVLKRAINRALSGEIIMIAVPAPLTIAEPQVWDLRFTPLMDTDGQVASVLVILRDVTPKV